MTQAHSLGRVAPFAFYNLRVRTTPPMDFLVFIGVF